MTRCVHLYYILSFRLRRVLLPCCCRRRERDGYQVGRVEQKKKTRRGGGSEMRCCGGGGGGGQEGTGEDIRVAGYMNAPNIGYQQAPCVVTRQGQNYWHK